MARIADLVVGLGADIASFRSGMEEANQHLAKMRHESSATASALQRLKEMAGAVISVEAARSMVEFGRGLIESTDEILHMSESIGISTTAFQALSFAARQVGVDQETFRREMTRLARSSEEAALGIGGISVHAFARLGIAVKDVHGNLLPVDQILNEVAQRLPAVSSATERTAIVTELFGREGAALIPVLDRIRESGVRPLIAAAQDMGVVLGEDDLVAAHKLENQMDVLSTVLHNQFARALIEDAPLLTHFGALLVEAARGAHDFASMLGMAPANHAEQLERLAMNISRIKERIAGEKDDLSSRWLLFGRAGAEAALKRDLGLLADAEKQLDALRHPPGAPEEPVSKLGPPPPDPAAARAAKAAADFQRELNQSLDTTREATRFQRDLAAAYDHGTAAVNDLQAAEAGRLALQRQINEATRTGQQVTAAQVTEIYDSAVALKQVTQAAQEHRKALQDQQEFDRSAQGRLSGLQEETDYYQRLAAAQKQGEAAVRALQAQHAGELAAQQMLADAEREHVQLSHQLLQTTYDRAKAEKEAELATQSLGGHDKESAQAMAQLTDQVARGASSFLQFATTVDHGRHSGQEFRRMLQGIAEDLEKTILQLTVLNPLQNAMGSLLEGPGYQKQPTLAGSPLAQKAASGGLSLLEDGAHWFEQHFLGISTPGGTPAGGNTSQTTADFAKWAKTYLLGPVESAGAWVANLIPHAQGGIVGGPTIFPMAAGLGLMGEAGPEAVMPLTRTGSGELGVRTAGGNGAAPNIHIINNTSARVADAQVQKHQNGRDWVITLGEAVAQDIFNGGPAARAMQQRFGLGQQPVPR